MLRSALLAAIVVPNADATLLRGLNEAKPASPDEIKKKWDKMDDFLETMFVMACSWKHGKDVDGKAGHALEEDDIEPKELHDYKGKLQAENVVGVKRACGMITSKGEASCRESCAKRLGTMDAKVMKERMKCDRQCITSYASFESSCLNKADELQEVNKIKQKMAKAKKACYEDHCHDFPTVWLKAKDDQADEVDKQCDVGCKEDRIKAKCEKKFALDIDFTMSKLKTECQGESELDSCIGDHKSDADTDESDCQDSGKSDCDSDFDTCKSRAKGTDKTAMEFCDQRKKKCLNQLDDTCLEAHEKMMKTGEKECEDEDDDRQKECVQEKVDDEAKTFVDDCVKETEPKCDEECHDEWCNTKEMNTCLDNLGSTSELTGEFCTDFWHLLHESSAVDPETGNPIVLLSKSAAKSK